VLNNLTGTPQYLAGWRANAPHVGDTVLEIGAGIAISRPFDGTPHALLAAEKDALHLHHSITGSAYAARDGAAFRSGAAGLARQPGYQFDTVLCLNVLEYLEHPGVLLDFLRGLLKTVAHCSVLCPMVCVFLESLDVRLGHRRAINKAELARLLEAHGFSLDRRTSSNKAGTTAWWITAASWRTENQQTGA